MSDRPSLSLESGCNSAAQQLSIFEMVQGAAMQEAIANHKRIRMEQQEQRHRERMQQYLESGDPILVAETVAWLRVKGDGEGGD